MRYTNCNNIRNHSKAAFVYAGHERKAMMKIDSEVESLIVKLRGQIADRLPAEHRRTFDDYIFLTLFHALRPHTPRGVDEAKKLVKKYNKANTAN